ncbi:hypothetical protein CVT24_011494 [Panaeolus cyanescens]|uniref:CHAT domain-containing protein n=1 Tax=Panaeolus cyanescens TaxID=181874 RepID=A0A409YGV6_9AGAR|nr:hypothetical protein CVT24_011494 [Panaeolus cyanescens]
MNHHYNDNLSSNSFNDELEREFEKMIQAESASGPMNSDVAGGVGSGSPTRASYATRTDVTSAPSTTLDDFGELPRRFLALMNERFPPSSESPGEPPGLSTATPEQHLDWLRNTHNKLRAELATLAQQHQYRGAEIPMSTLPSYEGGEELGGLSGGSYSVMDALDSFPQFLDAIEDSFRAMDMLQATPSQHDSTPPSMPSTSSAPSLSPPLAFRGHGAQLSILEKIASEASSKRNYLTMFMSEGLTRRVQQDEALLRSSYCELYDFSLSLPEEGPSQIFLHSALGVIALHLYEIIWERKLLDDAVMATSDAFYEFQRLGENLEKLPSLIRGFAYGQRLLAQATGEGEKLSVPVQLLELAYDILKDVEGTPGRVEDFLHYELACCLCERSFLMEVDADLNSAINHLQTICKGEIASSDKLCRLGYSHLHRFNLHGDLDDLDRASRLAVQAAGMQSKTNMPDMDLDRASGLHLSALCLEQKFYLQLDAMYLDHAIAKCRTALPMLREKNPFLIRCKCDLALLLFLRYESCGDRRDLDAAEAELLNALVLETQEWNIHVPIRVVLSFVQAHKAESLTEMDEAVQLLLNARKTFSGPAYVESKIEEFVSRAYRHRYNTNKPTDDLHSALHHARRALEKSSPTSPRRAELSLYLGQLLMLVYKQDSDISHCNEALSYFTQATKGTSGRPTVRFQAAKEWADAAEACHSLALVDALEYGLHLLPTVAWVGHRMPVQYRILSSQSSTFTSRAAAHAIQQNQLEKAVVYLEMGRNVLWTQALQFRAGSTAQKHAADMEEGEYLADYLSREMHDDGNEVTDEQLVQMMDQLPPTFLDLFRSLGGAMKAVRKQSAEARGEARPMVDRKALNLLGDQVEQEYREASLHNAARRWQALRQDLQSLGDSLDPSGSSLHGRFPQIDDLDLVLRKGPVVIINTYNHRSDAIVLFHKVKEGGVGLRHVALPMMSADDVHVWAESLREGIRLFETQRCTLAKYEETVLIPILRSLWRCMVFPIVQNLKEYQDLREKIWWCPTGPLAFLPIHAAGPYHDNEPGLLELVASSYIPTLNSLIRASKAASESFRLLAVAQPKTPGYSSLPGAKKEMAVIQEQFHAHPEKVTVLMNDEATVHKFTQNLTDKTWLHFACHAEQDEAYPFHSSFFLHDGPLKLSKLMRMDLTRVQFAMLSACLTSAGDAALPDECIHLAAGMQFSGVRSVVATMWSVLDAVGVRAAKGVYRHLLSSSKSDESVLDPDPGDAAKALQLALLDMKKAKVPLAYRVPFIHLGL